MTVLEQECRELASLLQLPSCTEQQDAVRSRLQHTIRSNRKWRDAKVHAYGSTACGLHTAASDFDFTVCGAQFAMEAKQACLQQAAAHCRRVELASPAASDLLTLRDLAQGDVRKATQLHADQTTSSKSKSKKLERMSEDVAVWTRAGSGMDVHERALSLWPLASLAELEEWMADELHATDGRVVRLKAEVVAAEARLARHTHSLSEVREADTNAVEHIEESRLAVGQARAVVQKSSKSLAYQLADSLRRSGYIDVVPIGMARVPLVACSDPRFPEIEIDISFNQLLSMERDALLRQYMSLHPLARPAALLVKAWSRERQVNSAAAGTLCSYGHVLSVIHYFQVCGLLPDLHQGCRPRWCDGVDVAFRTTYNRERAELSTQGVPNAELSTLLAGYFDYMARTAGGQSTLTLRAHGGTHLLPKTAWQPKGDERARVLRRRVSIEDPFETHACESADRRCDVASAVTERGMERLEYEWARAAQLLRDPSSSELVSDSTRATRATRTLLGLLSSELPSELSSEDGVRLVMRQLFGERPPQREEALDPRLLFDEPTMVQGVDPRISQRGTIDLTERDSSSKGRGEQDARGKQGRTGGRARGRRGRGAQARGRGARGGRGGRSRQQPPRASA